MSSITGSAGTLGLSMQETTDSLSALRASGSIWSGSLRQAILQAGGTWPPAGTKTTSGCSATGATSQTKGDSGDLVRLLIESSPGEQRRLWREQSRDRQTQPTRLRQQSNTTRRNLKRLKEARTYDGNGHLVRSAEEVIEISRLKARRRTLIFETVNMQPAIRVKADELRLVNDALYQLTDDVTYLFK